MMKIRGQQELSSVAFSTTNMAAQNNMACIRIASYNCRSVKNSIGDLKKLCSANDIILLQEHWLFPFELDYLSNIDNDFCAVSQSAMQLNDNVFRGRPYGGTAIMYRKKFAPFIVDQKSVSNPRVTALILNVNIDNSLTPVLLASVYMPVFNPADTDEDFEYICGYLNAMLIESNVNHFIYGGDFNFQFDTDRHEFVNESLGTT